jgi:multidrug efflux pump subunit AcrA (membrane-fusion protein)
MDAPHPPTYGVVLLGLISMAIFIGGFAAWSFFAPLAEAAIAEGVISVEGEHRVIANQEGGSVQELLVHDGDHVRTGQVLIRMNDAQASATAETAKAQRWTLLAQLARLDSEAAGDGKIQFQSELLAAAGGRGLDAARAAEAMSVQRAFRGACRQPEQPDLRAAGSHRPAACRDQLSRTTATGDRAATRSDAARGRGEADVVFKGIVEAE